MQQKRAFLLIAFGDLSPISNTFLSTCFICFIADRPAKID